MSARASRPDEPFAIVTGASSGIGRALCEHLLGAGWRVLGLGRRVASMPTHERFEGRPVDFGELTTLEGHLQALTRAQPVPDLLFVGGAGQGRFGRLEQHSMTQMRELVDLNFTSQAWLCRALVPGMKLAGRGLVIVLGSEAASRGRRRASTYGATKAALKSFAQALREEVATAGVRVSLVHPGLVRTPFFDALDFEPGPERIHALEADEVAGAILHIVEMPNSVVVEELDLRPLVNVVRHKKHSVENDE